MKAFDNNGRVLAYRHRVTGDGPSVVFANSLGSDQSIWDEVISDLGDRYSVLTYDLRGHGLSAVTESYSIQDLADDLIRLMETLGVSDAILCGVSVGGMVAQSLAARRPDLLRSVILSNTAPKIGSTERWNDRIEAVNTHGVEAVADAILQNWFSPSFRDAEPSRFALYRNMLCNTPREGYTATCAAIRDADLSDIVREITVPTLCLAGSADQSVPSEQVARMAEMVPAARFEEIEGVGHLPSLEASARVSQLIREMTDPA